MIRALLRRHGDFDRSDIIALALLFGLSVFDLFVGIPEVFLSIGVIFLFIIGPVGAVSIFGLDVHKDRFRFLEYLPIPRWQLCAANYIKALAGVVVVTVALFWHKVVFREPDVFPSRSEMVFGVGSILFALFSLAFFFCTYYEKRLILLLPIPFIGVPVVVSGIYFFGRTFLTPSPLEIAPICFVAGLLFSLAGFLLFVVPSEHMPRWKHFLFLGSPAFGVICGIAVGHLYWSALRWKELQPGEDLAMFGVVPVTPEGGSNLLVAEVRSSRSGIHAVCIDVDGRSYRPLGRGLEWRPAAEPKGEAQTLSFLSSFSPNGLLLDARYFVTVRPDGSGLRRVLQADEPLAYYRRRFRWSPSGESLVYVEHRYAEDSSGEYLVIADAAGKTRLEIPHIEDSHPAGRGPFLINERGFLVALLRTDVPEGEEQSTAEEGPYVGVDLETLDTQRFDLPGSVLAFSRDLTRAACIRSQVAKGKRYESLVLVEIPSLVERVILSEDEMPAVELGQQVTEDVNRFVDFDRFRDSGGGGYWGGFRFNESLDKAVWLKTRAEEDFLVLFLELIDLTSGESRVLRTPSEAGRVPLVRDTAQDTRMGVFGLTKAGDAVIYQLGEAIFLHNFAEDEPRILANLARKDEAAVTAGFELSRSPRTSFSPDRRHVLRQTEYSRYDDEPRPTETASTVEIFDEKGVPKLVFATKEGTYHAFWIDNDRIVIFGGDEVLLATRAKTGLEHIFPTRVPE